MEIEHGSVTSLVMSANGGMCQECKKFYPCLAEMINSRRDTS